MRYPRRPGVLSALLLVTALSSLVSCAPEGGGERGATAGGKARALPWGFPINQRIKVNQVGYLPNQTKIATLTSTAEQPISFVVKDLDDNLAVVYSGESTYESIDIPSDEFTHRLDFSSFTNKDDNDHRFRVDATIPDAVEGEEKEQWSAEFRVNSRVYDGMAHAALKYFYYNRTDDIDPSYLGDVVPGNDSKGTPWARYHERMASRVLMGSIQGRNQVPAFLGWTDYKFDARSYHWDAGDNAIYPENTATFMSLLMNLYERYGTEMKGFSLNIPTDRRAMPDLLTEIAFDANTMSSLLPPEDAKFKWGTPPLVPHKIALWDMFPYVKANAVNEYGAYTPKKDAYCNYVPPGCSYDGEDPSSSNCFVIPENLRPGIGLVDKAQADPRQCSAGGVLPIPVQEPTFTPWTGPGSDGKAPVSIAGTNGCKDRVRPVYASKPSLTATYAVARYLAQLSRLVRWYDENAGLRYWLAAKKAFDRADKYGEYDRENQQFKSGNGKWLWKNNPVDLAGGQYDYSDKGVKHFYSMARVMDQQKLSDYDGDGTVDDGPSDWNTPRGSGPYEDPNGQGDDRYAAAVEMYLTAYARGDSDVQIYRDGVTKVPLYKTVKRFDWQEDATLGTLSLLTAANDLPEADLKEMKSKVKKYADFIVTVVKGQGYPSAVPMPTIDPKFSPFQYGWTDDEGAPRDQKLADGKTPSGIIDWLPEYRWGSNKDQVYSGIVLMRAHDIVTEENGGTPQDDEYIKTAYKVFDYLLGNNPMDRSYVTGYGFRRYDYIHHRAALYAVGNYAAPPPKGWMVGGPMSIPADCGLIGAAQDRSSQDWDSEKSTPRLDPSAFDQNPPPAALKVAPPKAKGMAGGLAGAVGPDAADGWCTLEVTGDWNAGYAYLAFLLGEKKGAPPSPVTAQAVRVNPIRLPSSQLAASVAITPVAGARKYSIVRGTTAGSWDRSYESTSPTYIDQTVAAGRSYFYAVAVVNEGGQGAYSDPIQVTISNPPGLCTPTQVLKGRVNSTNLQFGTTGAVCVQLGTAAEPSIWDHFNCSNAGGRRFRVNGGAWIDASACRSESGKSVEIGTVSGVTVLEFSAGTYSWAAIAAWDTGNEAP